jgi:hypothetical protein
MRDRVAALALLCAAVGLAGCDPKISSTTPSATAPEITAITPQVTLKSSTPQPVDITGVNISSGVALTITTPDGVQREVPASQLDSLTGTSFEIRVLMDQSGAYRFVLRNPNGEVSSQSLVIVQESSLAPVIVGVSPPSPTHNAAFQSLGVQGFGFVDGAFVLLTDPDGLLVSNTVIGTVQPTGFQLTALLAKRGTYVLVATNPSGDVSNAFTFLVQ